MRSAKSLPGCATTSVPSSCNFCRNSGLVNEVASDFCLSPSTVGTHLYHIKQKLNVQNAAELTLVAVRNGLIES